jgi:hypothetical protein
MNHTRLQYPFHGGQSDLGLGIFGNSQEKKDYKKKLEKFHALN